MGIERIARSLCNRTVVDAPVLPRTRAAGIQHSATEHRESAPRRIRSDDRSFDTRQRIEDAERPRREDDLERDH